MAPECPALAKRQAKVCWHQDDFWPASQQRGWTI